MRPLDMVLNIADGKIHQPVVILASGDRDSGFVTLKNNGDKCCPIRSRILGNFILERLLVTTATIMIND